MSFLLLLIVVCAVVVVVFIVFAVVVDVAGFVDDDVFAVVNVIAVVLSEK